MTDNNLINFSCWSDDYLYRTGFDPLAEKYYIELPLNTKIKYGAGYSGMLDKKGEYTVTDNKTTPITFN